MDRDLIGGVKISKVPCQNCGKEVTVNDGAYFGIICHTCSERSKVFPDLHICPIDNKPCAYYGSRICTKDDTCIGIVKEG